MFEKTDLNEIFKLASILEPFSEKRVQDITCVTFIRSASADDTNDPLAEGMLIIPACHRGLDEAVLRIARQEGSSAFQVGVSALDEFLFDHTGLLETVNDLFNSVSDLDMFKRNQVT